MKRRKIALYVQSVKTKETVEKMGREKFVGQYAGVAPGGMAPPTKAFLVYDTESETIDMYVLPDDQKRAVETVMEIASEFSVEVKVVDVARMNALHRRLRKDVRGLKAFPTLMTDSGKKLDGGFSREKVERFLSETRE